MSPIIELQRRMVEAGRIRAGDKGTKGEPRKLQNWRLTSKDEVRLRAAAKLWGGEVRPWEGHAGEFELYTETASLPIMLIPGTSPTQWYELWSGGGCQRRCDGIHEIVSDSSCLCDEDRECKPITRLSVMLPDLPGIGSWVLTSTGYNAAAELVGTAELLQRASAQGVLVPARLRLQQDSTKKDGKTFRFVKPVIDIDVSVRELLGVQSGTAALPAGYTPISAKTGTTATLSEGLAAAESQTLVKQPRVPLPDDDIFEGAPQAVLEQGEASSLPNSAPTVVEPQPDASPPSPEEKPLTLAQAKKKLDAIVASLRKSGHIQTEHVWRAVARMRSVDLAEPMDVGTMIHLLGGRDQEGVLHWSPLRDDLQLEEARELHRRLARRWVEVQAELEQADAG